MRTIVFDWRKRRRTATSRGRELHCRRGPFLYVVISWFEKIYDKTKQNTHTHTINFRMNDVNVKINILGRWCLQILKRKLIFVVYSCSICDHDVLWRTFNRNFPVSISINLSNHATNLKEDRPVIVNGGYFVVFYYFVVAEIFSEFDENVSQFVCFDETIIVQVESSKSFENFWARKLFEKSFRKDFSKFVESNSTWKRRTDHR